MATKRNSGSINLIEIFSEFKELKNIDRETFINVMADSFRQVLSKTYGTNNYDVIINPDKGDLEVYRNREIVEDGEVMNENTQIAYSAAQEIDPECEVGEDITEKVELQSFGRRMILNLRQTLASKIMDLQKENLYLKYSDLLGHIVSGEVYQVWKKELLLMDDEGNELYLPKQNQIPTDFYKKGDVVRAVVVTVDNKNQNPKIILSRVSPLFLQRLFEQEVPEVHDGLIAVKNIARIPGERAKVAVESFDDRIDPVGACVGIKGQRIHGIVRELKNENIDVLNYTAKPQLMIQRALAPAKVLSITLNEETKTAEVLLEPDQVSLAIGKNGTNIRLASMLVGYEIEVMRAASSQDEDDIYLDEFNDEIDQWIIDAFKAIGLDTALSILNLDKDELKKRLAVAKLDLEDETIDEIYEILEAEYEEE